MPARLSRRELIAWMAAATGAAATGTTVYRAQHDASDHATSPAGTPRSSPGADDGPVARAAGSASNASPVDGPPLLVVLEMAGGNDGLSTAIPYGLGAYYDLRSRTAVEQSEVLRIDDEIGLSPSLVNLHQRGVSLVEGVGSFEPSGSHFEMLQRWWGGKSTGTPAFTGWVGRLADTLRSDDAPVTAISIGSGAHPILRSEHDSTMSLADVGALNAIVGADDDRFAMIFQESLVTLGSAAGRGDIDAALRRTMASTIDFSGRLLDDTADGGDDGDGSDGGWTGSGLSSALQLTATIFAADAGVRVVHVVVDGDYDTHEGHTWRHPQLMTDLDANLSAFHDDLERRGLGQRVLAMTTSEFGRTARDNDSGGLDHGTASTMLLSGPGTSGRFGEPSSLTKLDDNDDLVATLAFECYLAGVVEGWLDVPAGEVFGPSVEPLALSL